MLTHTISMSSRAKKYKHSLQANEAIQMFFSTNRWQQKPFCVRAAPGRNRIHRKGFGKGDSMSYHHSTSAESAE